MERVSLITEKCCKGLELLTWLEDEVLRYKAFKNISERDGNELLGCQEVKQIYWRFEIKLGHHIWLIDVHVNILLLNVSYRIAAA